MIEEPINFFMSKFTSQLNSPANSFNIRNELFINIAIQLITGWRRCHQHHHYGGKAPKQRSQQAIELLLIQSCC